MIVSASRRTDIPALYPEWFMNRMRAGFCTVPNPFNAKQVSTIPLNRTEVDAIVFWTRYPARFLPMLDELDAFGIPYTFLFTLMSYPPDMEPNMPSFPARLDTFLRLAERVGPDRVAWRYDPIVLSRVTNAFFHQNNFQQIATLLQGATHQCIVSVMDPYGKTVKRMKRISEELQPELTPSPESVLPLLADMAAIAEQSGMTFQTCAQSEAFANATVRPGACIDAARLNTVFNLSIPCHKDSGQRPHCLCSASRDIGMYDSCVFGCTYCYANADFARSVRNRAAHDPLSPSLLGHHPPDAVQKSLFAE
ncbi:DUF1848 domain-containing protein [Pseudodesulfovibrio tunisiensis]|uniref:DUF1848 domain-containing protein n=1 Tax=Pseudodesulfovibrio tunisiensis TaxID=463192 RepID=UPI001FB1BF33|nr:DUF1848 domain-containing protein [Pseudodesulfovibrio tunisiensis]